ncbi:MAG: terminase family protein [Pirellulales bacterium]|nr:terminase family protein [Pirellulales bacterium]
MVAATTRRLAELAARARRAGNPAILRKLHAAITWPLYTFTPRPDSPGEYDQQTGFLEDRAAKLAICLGGTGSGKTEAAAAKTARYLFSTPPPRHNCPFWIIGETYDMVCRTCWDEKLSRYIPAQEILGFDWYKPKRNWPFAVILRHPRDRTRPGWVLEFKSYAQGRERFQAVSIGGYWFNEAAPWDIVTETQGRCREYDSPGWADFTPIDVADPRWTDEYDNPRPGWTFYHLNTRKNTALAPGWAERFLAGLPEDERRTRETGHFAAHSGLVYKEFNERFHLLPEDWEPPRDWHRVRAIDFGFANPFCCLWIARDHDGAYYVYDEHYRSGMLNSDHAAAIKARRWLRGAVRTYGPTYSDHDAQQRAELAAEGIVCTPAKKDLRAGIAHLRRLFMIQENGRARLYISAKCKHLRRELKNYKWPEGSDTRNPAEEPIDRDNHACDALRYGIYSDHRGLAPPPHSTKPEWKQHATVQLRGK